MKGSGKLTCVSGAIGALKETLKELSESAMSSMHFRQGNLSAQRGAFCMPVRDRESNHAQIAQPCSGRNLRVFVELEACAAGRIAPTQRCAAKQRFCRHEYVHVHLHLHHRHLRPS